MKTKAKESHASHLDLFSRFDISSAKGLVTSQHSVPVRQGRCLLKPIAWWSRWFRRSCPWS